MEGNLETEIMATSILKSKIASTDILKPFITENDKEPIWDGYINIYSSPRKSNKDLINDVPVQIKGKLVKSLNKENINFSITKESLKAFATKSGTMFFVVYFINDKEYVIYYKILLPITTNRLLKDIKNNKTIRVNFASLPTDKLELQELFINFSNDSKKQGVLLNPSHYYNIDSILKNNNSQQFSFSYSFFGGDNNNSFSTDRLFSKNLCLYANMHGIEIPVNEFKVESISRNVDRPISIKEKVFFEKYSVVSHSNHQELCFGNLITFIFDKSKHNQKLQFTAEGSLNEQIAVLDFVINFVHTGEMTVDTHTFHIIADAKKKWEEEVNIDDLVKYKNHLDKIKEAITLAGTTCDLAKLDGKDSNTINALIANFVNKQFIDCANDSGPIFRIKLGNLKLLLFANRNSDNKYKLENFFSSKLLVTVSKDDETTKHHTSQFAIMKEDDFVCDNINYDFILKDIFSIKHNELSFSYINILLLEMLNAYDHNKTNNKQCLLETSITLAKWLMDSKTESLQNVSELNYMQAIKRKRILNTEEKKLLINMLNMNQENETLPFGIYILLEQYDLAEQSFNQFSEDNKELFQKYPIFNLWKRT